MPKNQNHSRESRSVHFCAIYYQEKLQKLLFIANHIVFGGK
jgi:hypothetical protein